MYNLKNICRKLLINFNKYKFHIFCYKLFFTYPLSIFIFIKERAYTHIYILTQKTAKDRFTFIYKHHFWKGESKSGFGSGIEYTKNLRMQLPKIIETFKIKSILDAPCGDFLWMQQLLPKLTIDKYIGADIIDELIDINKTRYANKITDFITIDITKDKLPYADLLIVRDCLFHLSYTDINLFLKNFNNSKIKYLLTTTHLNPNRISGAFVNKDIITADCRLIDLFAKPFNFNKKLVLETIDDWIEPEPERQMILLEKSAVPTCLFF